MERSEINLLTVTPDQSEIGLAHARPIASLQLHKGSNSFRDRVRTALLLNYVSARETCRN